MTIVKVNIPSVQQTEELHNIYCRLTGLQIKYSMYSHWIFERFLAEGFTRDDLELTIRYVNRLIKQGQRKIEAFKLRYFIEDLAGFADNLAIARATSRIKPLCANKVAVLKATGRIEQDEDGVKSAAQVIAGDEALKELIRVRDSL